MRKVIGVGAVLLLAGAVMAPANAATPVTANVPSAVASTVSVEAPADAVVDFESPTVETVAAPVPEAVPVAPVVVEDAPVEPVEAPAVVVAPVAAETPSVQPAETGGTVTETENPAEVVPETPAEPTPEPVEPDPVPTPEPTEEVVAIAKEGDQIEYSEFKPECWDYDVNPETGEKFAGTYVGTHYAKSADYWAGQNVEIRKQPGVEMHPDMNPNGTDVLYVFHIWTAVE